MAAAASKTVRLAPNVYLPSFPISANKTPKLTSFDTDESGKLVQHDGPSAFVLPNGVALGTYIMDKKYEGSHKFPPGMSGDVYKLEFAGADGTPINYVLKHVNKPEAIKFVKPEIEMLQAVKGKWFAVQLLAAQLNLDGTAFMLFPFIPGKEFLDILIELQDKAGDVTKAERESVLEIIAEIVRGLLELHTLGIIHRDIKPENIWVPDDKSIRPFLLDFGLSSYADKPQFPAGTLKYIRPSKTTQVQRFPTPNDNYYPLAVVINMLPKIFGPSGPVVSFLAKNGLTNAEVAPHFTPKSTRRARRARRSTRRSRK